MTPRTLVPVALLLLYAAIFGARALGAGPLGFDDHPGQLYRVWHVVTHGVAPWRWNDGWWAGYPELQFYPPAFAYLAALVHALTAGTLPVERAYHTVVWVAYLAPGVATWVLLQRVLGDGWLALPPAFIALTLSAGIASGVEGGVRVGMVAARLAWALVPVTLLVLHRRRQEAAGPVAWTAPLLAAIVLMHPAHLPVAAAAIVLAVFTPASDRRARVVAAAGALGLGALLTGFWSVPLVARLAETRALAWGDLTLAGLLDALLRHPLLVVLLGLAAAAIAVARSPIEIVLARLPWVMVVIVALDAVVLERLGARWLAADRVADGAWLAVILAAGLGAGRLLERAARASRVPLASLALGAVAVVTVISLPHATLTLWPRARDWPSLGAITRGLRVDALWTALSGAPRGRILFVRSGVPLVYGEEWWRPHSHVTAMTPVGAGRAIVHGTFTHPSPIAALVYRGATAGGPITTLAERLDGHSLFGQPLAALDAATLDRVAAPLRISAVVAIEDDLPRLAALDRDPAFARGPGTSPFVVWTRREPVDVPVPLGGGRWRVRGGGEPGQWVSAGVTYYPLWRAFDGDTPIPTRRGRSGDLEVRLARRDATIDLTYAPGVPEIAGVGVTILALTAWATLAWREARREAPG